MQNPKGEKKVNEFRFKQFTIKQDICAMKVNTDGVLLGAWCDASCAKRALDIGTGTGVIAMMLAQKNKSLMVDAIDIDENAYLQAKENFESNTIGQQIRAYHEGLQEFADEKNWKYDLVVSNPPFFTGGTFSYNENKAYVRHTIKLSHSELLQNVQKLLKGDGFFDVILPFTEGLRFIQIAGQYGLFACKKTEVYSRPGKSTERLLIRFSKIRHEIIETDTLSIMKVDQNEYSDEYKLITRDYYLAFG